MPLNLPDFLRAPIQRNEYTPLEPQNPLAGLENLIPNTLSAYHAPQKLKEERETAERKKKAEELANNFLSTYGPRRNEAEIKALERGALSPLGLLLQERMGLTNPKDISAMDRMISTQTAGATTPAQKDLAAIYGAGTPEFNDALKEQYQIPTNNQAVMNAQEEGVPGEVVGGPLRALPKNEQLFYVKKMEGDLQKAHAMTESIKTLNHMKSIMEKYPHLWKSFSLMLLNPENKSGIEEYIKRNVINEDEKTAADIFRKLSSELVAKGGEALGGGQNFTDKRQELYSSMKPDVANTAAANNFLIDNLIDLMSGGPLWEKSLRYGLKNRVKIIDNPTIFREGYKIDQGLTGSEENQASEPLPYSIEELIEMRRGSK